MADDDSSIRIFFYANQKPLCTRNVPQDHKRSMDRELARKCHHCIMIFLTSLHGQEIKVTSLSKLTLKFALSFLPINRSFILIIQHTKATPILAFSFSPSCLLFS